LEQFVKLIVENLIDRPDQLTVHSHERDGILTISVSVAAEDFGKVIGKKGRTATAIRVLVVAAGAKQGKRVRFELEEDQRRQPR
jgi:uncharacterized protein